MLSRRSGFAKLSSSLPYPWYNWPPLASATETLKWNFQIGPYMKQGNLLFGIYLSDSKYQRTYITDATVCLSVIQSKSSDVNPIWPSLFQHIQKPLPEKSWNQLAHSHSQLCAFYAQCFVFLREKFVSIELVDAWVRTHCPLLISYGWGKAKCRGTSTFYQRRERKSQWTGRL